MALAPGTRLGTYQISAPLGAGGMGEVYRARDTRLGREVAVKVLPGAVTSSADRLARFEREARTVAGLNHPNIVTLFSVEDEEGIRFLTMELVEGQSLDRVVTPGGLPLSRVLDLAIPMANALIAAHERGVVHRDLKPGNVMVTHDGWVKVLDFGLAKVAAEPGEGPGQGATIGATVESPISGEGQVLGTVPYMAPEQIRGEAVDARSDLFALGIILYELATGRRPFTGMTSADVSSAILRDAPVPVLSLRADLPRDLNRIITRCLEKNPRDRFQTARDVYNELRYIQKELAMGPVAPPSTPPPSAGYPAAPATPAPSTPTPRPAASPSSGGSSAAPRTPAPASSGSSASGLSSGVVSGHDVPSIAVLPFINRSRGEEDEYFSDGLADELLNVLTKIRGLRVAARASSFQFKGKNEDLAVIGEKLNVATLLDGSVRKSGNRVRISVQLVKASDRVQLWSETYDRSLEDIFAVQDDIAQSVVKELRTTLLGEAPDSDASGAAKAEVAVAAQGHGQNPEAHRLYLQGKYFIDRVTQEDTAKGMKYLKQAVAIDPSHAAAWAELSRAHANSGGFGWEPVIEGYRNAREAANRALQLAPDLAEAHVMLSDISQLHDWNWKSAEESTRRALQLAPGSAVVLRSAGRLAHILCRYDEAEGHLRRAIEQDPLNSSGYSALGQLYRSMDRLPDAETMYRKCLELSPQRISAHLVLAIILADQGRHAEALAEALQEPAEWARLTALAGAHFKAMRMEESAAALRELEAKHAVDSAYQIAAIHTMRGDLDRGFAWLDRAIAERDAGTAQTRSESLFRPLHGDPRWGALMQKLGFEA
ncbi:MAG TPA: protein kinase [Candidatus Eisenbacteria bacterium]|nr:protein kinase [Candidatus Eisenbacteria bacterium]